MQFVDSEASLSKPHMLELTERIMAFAESLDADSSWCKSEQFPVLPSANRLKVTLREILQAPDQGLQIINAAVERAKADIEAVNLQALGETDQTLIGNYGLLLRRAAKEARDHETATLFSSSADRIEKVLADASKLERSLARQVEFLDIFAGFSEPALAAIGRNLAFIQMTKGCSVGCSNCNLNALVVPRVHLSWNAVREIIDRWGDDIARNDSIFYYASDPLDWRGIADDGSVIDYRAIDRYLRDKLGKTPQVTTAIPRGNEEAALELWDSDTFVRFSSSDANYRRLLKRGFWSGTNADELDASLPPPGNPRSHVVGATWASEWDQPDGEASKPLLFETGASYNFDEFTDSVSCLSGTIITPDGAFNLCGSATTPYTPNAATLDRITPATDQILGFRLSYHNDRVKSLYMPHHVTNVEDGKSGRYLAESTLFDSTVVLLRALLHSEIREYGTVKDLFDTGDFLPDFADHPKLFSSEKAAEFTQHFQSRAVTHLGSFEALLEECRGGIRLPQYRLLTEFADALHETISGRQRVLSNVADTLHQIIATGYMMPYYSLLAGEEFNSMSEREMIDATISQFRVAARPKALGRKLARVPEEQRDYVQLLMHLNTAYLHLVRAEAHHLEQRPVSQFGKSARAVEGVVNSVVSWLEQNPDQVITMLATLVHDYRKQHEFIPWTLYVDTSYVVERLRMNQHRVAAPDLRGTIVSKVIEIADNRRNG